MKIITAIKVVEIGQDVSEVWHELHHAIERDAEFFKIDGTLQKTAVVKEWIKGRQFYNPHTGELIVLGVSQEVGELLGLQYAAFEELEYQVAKERDRADRLERQGERIRNMRFLDRLKCLFTGYKFY